MEDEPDSVDELIEKAVQGDVHGDLERDTSE
jgi:hypothetical protein